MGFHQHEHLHVEKRENFLHKRPSKDDNKENFIHKRPSKDDNKENFIHKRPGASKKENFLHKRPNEDDNKMRFIHKRPELNIAQKEAAAETVYTQVYVTESKAFTGDATYVTKTAGSGAQKSQNAAQSAYEAAKSAANSPNAVTSASSASPASSTSVKSIHRRPTSQTVAKGHPMNTSQTTSQTASQTALKGPPIHHTAEATAVKGHPLSASSTSSSNLISQHNDGMSTGAKAGLAFGIIAAIALCGGLIFFCWRRKKNAYNRDGAEKLVDEKHASGNSFFGGTAAAVGSPAGDLRGSVQSNQTTRTAATAPRLSLRPVTQFLPNILGGENRKSAGNALNVPQMSEKPRSGWDRRPEGARQDPFGDAAAIDEKQARSVSPVNPFDEGDGAVATTEKTTPNHSQKNSWEGTEPSTPKSTKFGTAAAVPITAARAANGAEPRGANDVHRVQLEFKPSMEDELGLHAGQIVRMLHEYDDGWCLCIRMDRSQQGVCPRTCLSKLPVKPRQGPPPQNGPPGRPRGPPPPGMGRPASPAMHNNMVPRPLTPTGRERSATMGRNSPAPGPSARPRSQSVGAGNDGPMSSAGMPPRKPVPGMAL